MGCDRGWGGVGGQVSKERQLKELTGCFEGKLARPMLAIELLLRWDANLPPTDTDRHDVVVIFATGCSGWDYFHVCFVCPRWMNWSNCEWT